MGVLIVCCGKNVPSINKKVKRELCLYLNKKKKKDLFCHPVMNSLDFHF